MSFKIHVTGPISSTSSLPTSSQVLCQEQSHTLSSTMPSAKSSTKSSATWSRTKSKIPSGGRGPQSLAISAESCGRNSCKHSEAARTRWWRPPVPWKGPAQSLLANSAASCGAGRCSTQRGAPDGGDRRPSLSLQIVQRAAVIWSATVQPSDAELTIAVASYSPSR